MFNPPFSTVTTHSAKSILIFRDLLDRIFHIVHTIPTVSKAVKSYRMTQMVQHSSSINWL